MLFLLSNTFQQLHGPISEMHNHISTNGTFHHVFNHISTTTCINHQKNPMSSCLDHQAKRRIVKRGACASVEMSQVALRR